MRSEGEAFKNKIEVRTHHRGKKTIFYLSISKDFVHPVLSVRSIRNNHPRILRARRVSAQRSHSPHQIITYLRHKDDQRQEQENTSHHGAIFYGCKRQSKSAAGSLLMAAASSKKVDG